MPRGVRRTGEVAQGRRTRAPDGGRLVAKRANRALPVLRSRALARRRAILVGWDISRHICSCVGRVSGGRRVIIRPLLRCTHRHSLGFDTGTVAHLRVFVQAALRGWHGTVAFCRCRSHLTRGGASLVRGCRRGRMRRGRDRGCKYSSSTRGRRRRAARRRRWPLSRLGGRHPAGVGRG